MKKEFDSRSLISVFVFAVFLLVPSCDTLLKYFGTKGVAAYLIIGFLFLLAAYKFVLPVFLSRLTERQADVLALLTFAALTAFVLIVYPLANSGRLGAGSDADDALVAGVGELFAGRYPYYAATYLGNPISPLPGAMLLSIPFVLIRFVALQNVFWLGAFFLVVRKFLKSGAFALILLWTILIFSPTVMQNLATGADYAANTIYVLLAMWLMVETISDRDAPAWKKILPTVLFGVALSSRSNFLLLAPLLFSALVQNAGLRTAIKYCAIAGAVFLLVTLPFYLYDPTGFAPLYVQSSKLTKIEDVLPFARFVVPLASAALAALLSIQKMGADCAVLFRNSAVVQIFILLFTALVSSIHLGKLDLFFGQSGYGMFTLFFGSLAVWMFLHNNKNVSALETSS